MLMLGCSGGYIAAITSADEQSWIAGAIADNSLSFDNWIGLTDDEAYGGNESFDGGANHPGAPYLGMDFRRACCLHELA